MMKALLIIDMQKVSFTPETPRFDADAVVNRINNLSEFFRKRGDKVIHIQHDGMAENFCYPESEEWQILDTISVEENDLRIGKTANDCFYKSELETTLDDLGIKELVITGCATDFCVDTTIRSAFSKNYLITVVSDAHTTADRPHLKAKNVIEHHNFIWAGMTPIHGNRVKLSSCDNYIPNG